MSEANIDRSAFFGFRSDPPGGPWTDVYNALPSNSRTVDCVGQDGIIFRGFYWRAENLWYRASGSKRKKDAAEVIKWREVSIRSEDDNDGR